MIMKKLIYILTFILVLSESLNAQDVPVYKVSRMPFNSGPFSEISPVIVQDNIIFCSDRRFSSVKDRTAYDGRRLYNIYIARKIDSTRWDKPEKLNSERSTRFNSGPLSIAPDGKTVYFTSEVETGSSTKKKNFKNHSGIFIADLSGTELQSLRPFKYNSPGYQVANPSVSRDGKYLFFASDMPGGQGKSDIYYCEFENGEWSAPVNPGPQVNSPGADNFPFMHPSGKLYFSSERQGGMGKLDVYSTALYNGAWDVPVLLSEPVNSKADDFAFVATDDLQTGYFSSNRLYSDDIFSFSSTIIRKASCNLLVENSYCYQFIEENAVKYDTVPFLYKWRFSDGGNAEGAVAEHCFPGPGKYVFYLDVINLVTKEVINNEKTDTVVVEDEIQPYIAGPDSAGPGEKMRMDATKTNLPGWQITQYYWNFGDETIATGKQVDKTFTRPGKYEVQLIITAAPEPGGALREACVSKIISIGPKP